MNLKKRKRKTLEKDKKKDTPEDKQVNFSSVDSQTILPNPIDITAKLELDKSIGHKSSSKYFLTEIMRAQDHTALCHFMFY